MDCAERIDINDTGIQHDLSDSVLFRRVKHRGVSNGAKKIINYFRIVHPEALTKKERGKAAELMIIGKKQKERERKERRWEKKEEKEKIRKPREEKAKRKLERKKEKDEKGEGEGEGEDNEDDEGNENEENDEKEK